MKLSPPSKRKLPPPPEKDLGPCPIQLRVVLTPFTPPPEYATDYIAPKNNQTYILVYSTFPPKLIKLVCVCVLDNSSLFYPVYSLWQKLLAIYLFTTYIHLGRIYLRAT